MVNLIILLVFFYFVSRVSHLLTMKWTASLKKLGAIVLAYGVGLLLRTAGLFQREAKAILRCNNRERTGAYIPKRKLSRDLISEGKAVTEAISRVNQM